MNKLDKLVFVHYNMRLRVRNLTCKSDTDDYYNPIDLNNIFNDDILDEWIREEQPMLPSDDLSWLDEGIRRSDEVAVMVVMVTTMVIAVMMTAVMAVTVVMMMTVVIEVMAVIMKRLLILVEANKVVL